MRPHKPNGEEERFARLLPDQLDCFRGSLTIGVNQVVVISFHHDKRISANDRFLSVGVSFEGLASPRSLPFRTGAVESLGPRGRIVRTITAVFDPARHSHVEDLADPRGVV